MEIDLHQVNPDSAEGEARVFHRQSRNGGSLAWDPTTVDVTSATWGGGVWGRDGGVGGSNEGKLKSQGRS